MRNRLIGSVASLLLFSASVVAQTPSKPMSPEGSAHVQVLGTWAKGQRPAFTLGRETYQNGKWIEITYGKAANDVGAPGFPPPPVWRAGANQTTRLKTGVPLTLGATTVPPGEYSLFIDLKGPSEWTLIVSRWAAQVKFDPQNKDALWGAYGYTPDKDVVRVPMKVDTLPFAVDELTWTFVDMTNDSGKIALIWGKSIASTPFKAAR